MLHGETPGAPRLLETWDDAAAPGAGGEEGAGALGVADGGGEADTPRVHACHAGEALDEAERLAAAVAAQERMHLVDHHVAQVAKEARYLRMAVHEQGLERFRCDLQDARGMLHELALVRLRHVAVPAPNGNIGLDAKVLKAHELVVDERFEWADIDGTDACRRVLPEIGEDGEERGLRFAGRSLRGEQHVLIGVEDGFCSRHLDGAKALPVVVVDEVLHERRVAIEDAHSVYCSPNLSLGDNAQHVYTLGSVI